MQTTERWLPKQEMYAFLVALDISGFSRFKKEPNQLLAHRKRFFQAVEQTSFFAQAKSAQTVVVHFLGDELRLAFLASVGARAVSNFLDNVLILLKEKNIVVKEDRQTHVKGVVFAGPMIWQEWHNCSFLDGVPPFTAQQWMGELQPGDIVADNAFKEAVEVDGIPSDRWLSHNFSSGETGYFLHRGA